MVVRKLPRFAREEGPRARAFSPDQAEADRSEGDAVPGGADPRQIERLVASTSRREAG